MHPQPNGSERIVYIDVLRIFAVLWLIPFHTARIYDIWEPNYIKSPTLSIWLTVLIGFTGPWHMPLFFLLAGASTWLALGFRDKNQYLKERVSRLLIPLIFCGLFIIPILPYLALLDHGIAPYSYFSFLKTYYRIDPDDLTGYFGTFTPSHLWFIIYLFVFSVITLPFFYSMHNKSAFGQKIREGFAIFFSRPGFIFLFIIPLSVTDLLPDLGGKNPFYYITLYILGYLILSDARYMRAIDSQKKFAMITGIPSLIILIWIWFTYNTLEGISFITITYSLFHHYVGWALLIAILGYGKEHLNKPYPWLKHASEIAFPFYIVHQVVIGILGFFIIRWIPSIDLSFIIICALSFLFSLGFCELVKLSNLTRFAFGMKFKSKIPI
jgi:hypothetical protein